MISVRSISGAAALLLMTGEVRAQESAESAETIEATVRTALWRSEEIAVGIVWHAHHFEKLGPGPQHVHVLELADAAAELVPARARTGLARTSQMGSEGGAVAAVNGGFFGPRGEALGLLQVDGAVLAPGIADTPWVAGMTERGELLFERRESGGFEGVAHAIAGKPLLLRAGRIVPEDLGGPRHPRTAIGRRADGARLLLTCDGRTPSSLGLTVGELAHVMRALDCGEAMNLDGGGSTTLWVRNEPDAGVVSCPCDNKIFDHAGERAVSNAVLAFARDVLQCDEDDPEVVLEPASAWSRAAESRALYGDCARADRSANAAVVGRFVPARSGRHALEIAFAPETRLLVLHVPGRSWRAERESGGGRWSRVGELCLVAEAELELRITRYPGQALAFDALRWVELDPVVRAR